MFCICGIHACDEIHLHWIHVLAVDNEKKIYIYI